MADVGDRVILTLTVSPSDATTSASVVATSPPPLNVPTTLTPVPNDAKSIWTVPLTLSAAGEWKIAWTVTGTGANVEYDTVYAIPQPTGRSYATLTDLAGWLMTEPPAGSARRLIQATRKIDQMLIGARYPVNVSEMPTDANHVVALRDAVCAQCEWWVETGDLTGAGVSGSWDSVKIGSVSLARKSSSDGKGSSPAYSVSPIVAEILQGAGLLPVHAIIYG